MTERKSLNRRKFLGAVGVSVGGIALGACDAPTEERYSQADMDLLAAQRNQEEKNQE